MRIGDDGTLRSLTENLFQSDARHNSGADDASQNITRTDTGKLIFVPNHDDPARRPQRTQQAFKKYGIDHAHLVDDHRITAKLVLFVVKKADKAGIVIIHFQQTVNRRSFPAGQLGEPFGGTACRRRQRDTVALLFERFDHAVDGRRLSGSRPAGQNEDAVFQCRTDRITLKRSVGAVSYTHLSRPGLHRFPQGLR